jgi:hypothetical protein
MFPYPENTENFAEYDAPVFRQIALLCTIKGGSNLISGGYSHAGFIHIGIIL